jgi:WD40 repeat protein
MHRARSHFLLVPVLVLACGQAFPAAPAKSTGQKGAQPPRPSAKDIYGDPLPAGAIGRLGTIRWRDPDGEQLSFSRDGKTIISAGRHGVKWFDPLTGKVIREKKINLATPEDSQKRRFAFSHDYRTLAVSDPDESRLVLWDVQGKKVLRQIEVSDDVFASLAFSPDGTLLAGRPHRESTVQLWRVATGKELPELGDPGIGPEQGSNSMPDHNLVFSADAKLLAWATCEGVIHLWALKTRKPIDRIAEKSGHVHSLIITGNGRTLAWVNGEGAIRLWDVFLHREIRCMATEDSSCQLCFSPDGRILAFGDKDGFIRFWSVASGKKLQSWPKLGLSVSTLSFAPDGNRLVARVGSSIRLCNVATGKVVNGGVGHSQGVYSIAFAVTDQTVCSVGSDATIRLWKRDTTRQWRCFRSKDAHFIHAALSLDGKSLALVDDEGRRSLWQTGSAEKKWEIPDPTGTALCLFTFSADGKTLTSLESDESIRLWETATGRELRKLPLRESHMGALISFDGRVLALTYGTGDIRVYETFTGKEISHVKDAPREVQAMALSPDAKTVACWLGPSRGELEDHPDAAKHPGCLSLREVATGQERRRFAFFKEDVPAIAFSPDNRTIGLIEGDRLLRTRDLKTGRLLQEFRGPHGLGPALAFSPDGKILASGCDDATILLWRVRNHDHPAHRLTARELEQLWADLASADAARAYQAIETLDASPELTVPFLARRLRPVLRAKARDAKAIAELIDDLDSNRYRVRRRAMQNLDRLEELARPVVQKTLAANPSLETRLRLQALLRKWHFRTYTTQELRLLRAVEVLERIGTPEAAHVLRTLADGEPLAWLTQEARAALTRLAMRSGVWP